MNTSRRTFTDLGYLAVVLAIGLTTPGCETVVRENVLTSIDTGIGATLAENKETQMYEFKAGYIRSQLYSIPTGKIVKNDGSTNDTVMVTSTNGATQGARYSNAANITPQVVSGIKSSTGLQDLVLGMTVAENFAVGEVAVNSPAAIAMYISQAQNSNNAASAASAVRSSGTNVISVAVENHMADISDAYHSITNADLKATWDSVFTGVTGEPYTNLVAKGTSQQWNNVYTILQSRSLIK